MKNKLTRDVKLSNDNFVFLDGIRFALNLDSIDDAIEYLIEHSNTETPVLYNTEEDKSFDDVKDIKANQCYLRSEKAEPYVTLKNEKSSNDQNEKNHDEQKDDELNKKMKKLLDDFSK